MTRETYLETLAERVRTLEKATEALAEEDYTTVEDIESRPEYVIEFLLDLVEQHDKNELVTPRQFKERYEAELDKMFSTDEKVSVSAHIYGYPVKLTWNGLTCDLGDGAIPTQALLPALTSVIEESEA